MTPLQRQLEARRREKKWSRRKLSLKAGMSETAVKAILHGKSQHPRQDTLEKLAGALECTVEDLLARALPDRHSRAKGESLDQGLMLNVIVHVLAYVEQSAVEWSFPDIAKRMLVIYGRVSEANEKEREEKLFTETGNVFDITDRLGRIG